MSAEQPSYFMTVAELAEFLRFTVTVQDPDKATRQWLKRHDVPVFKRARHLIVSRSAVIDALAATPSITKRAAKTLKAAAAATTRSTQATQEA